MTQEEQCHPQNRSVSQRLYYALCFISGICWSAIAYLIGSPHFQNQIWGGVVFSPLVGLFVGWIFLPHYRSSTKKQVWMALLLLYMAACCFAIAMGVTDILTSVDNRVRGEVVIEHILAVWWGITYSGLFVLLWPLAYVNHLLLRLSLGSNR